MRANNRALFVAVSCLIFLGACGTTPPPTITTEPVPTLAASDTFTVTASPTSTPTVVPPTRTPPALITSPDLLIGNWQPLSKNPDAMFLQVNADGTCRQSYTLAGLSAVPEVECSYKFEGDWLVFTVVTLIGVPECPSPSGAYEVQLLPENRIRLVKADDSCQPRVRSTSGPYERIP